VVIQIKTLIKIMTELNLDCNSPTLLTDLLSQLESAMEPEELLMFLYKTVDKLQKVIGEKASQYKEELGKKFAAWVRGLGMSLPVVNQVMKAQEAAANLEPQVAEELDVPTLKKLAEPKNAQALEAIAQLDECSVELAQDIIREHRLPKEPKNPWVYAGAANTADGKPREYQLPRVSETIGVQIEAKKQQNNISPRQIIEQALTQYFETNPIQQLTTLPFSTDVLADSGFQVAQKECTEYLEAQVEKVAPQIKKGDGCLYRGSEQIKRSQEPGVGTIKAGKNRASTRF
jgi:hypothetical protein